MKKYNDVIEYTKNDKKIVKSFYPKNSLSNIIFNSKNSMHSNIREKLLEISDEYIGFIGIDFFIHDIVITGSFANYNWSNYSDIDVHIIVDFENQKHNIDIMKEFFDAKEKAWKSKHNIKIKNFDVELYVQDTNEKTTSTGVFSILKNKWIIEPQKVDVVINDKKILTKADSYANKINSLIEKMNFEDITDELNSLYKKIKKFRKCGLDYGGEYSYENLTFKLLRRNGYIKKLLDLKTSLVNNKLSIKQ